MGCCGWQDTDRVATVPSAPGSASLADLVATHRTRAELDLEQAAGGTPICRVAGDRLSPVKHAEGRAAAMADLARRLRGSGDGGAEAGRRAVQEVAATWQAALEGAGRLGPAWQAYRQGGVDELAALTAEIERRRL